MTSSRVPSNIWEERRGAAATKKSRVYLQQDADGIWGWTTTKADADGNLAKAPDGTVGIESPRVSEDLVYRSNAGVLQIFDIPDES